MQHKIVTTQYLKTFQEKGGILEKWRKGHFSNYVFHPPFASYSPFLLSVLLLYLSSYQKTPKSIIDTCKKRIIFVTIQLLQNQPSARPIRSSPIAYIGDLVLPLLINHIPDYDLGNDSIGKWGINGIAIVLNSYGFRLNNYSKTSGSGF